MEHPVIAKKTTAKAPIIIKTNTVAIVSKMSCTMLELIGWLRFISLPFLVVDGSIILYNGVISQGKINFFLLNCCFFFLAV